VLWESTKSAFCAFQSTFPALKSIQKHEKRSKSFRAFRDDAGSTRARTSGCNASHFELARRAYIHAYSAPLDEDKIASWKTSPPLDVIVREGVDAQVLIQDVCDVATVAAAISLARSFGHQRVVARPQLSSRGRPRFTSDFRRPSRREDLGRGCAQVEVRPPHALRATGVLTSMA
jgi:hypothetical protein